MNLDNLIFACFNGYVVCLNRNNGRLVWKNKLRTGYMTLLLDGDRLIVSSSGYMFCLDPLTGDELWSNDLPGTGTGVPALASVRGHSPDIAGNSAQQTSDQSAASNSSSHT